MKRAFLISFVIGFIIFFGLRILQVRLHHEPQFAPQPISFQFQPPTNSLAAQIIMVTGDVTKVPLNSTNSATLKVNDSVLAGEPISVGSHSDLNLKITNFLQATASAETSLSLVSGNPKSLLLQQSNGSAEYQTLSSDVPVSIRTLHFLIVFTNGQIKVTTNQQTNKVTVSLTTGSAKIAWEDQNLNSQLLNLLPLKSYTLNDNTKKIDQK